MTHRYMVSAFRTTPSDPGPTEQSNRVCISDVDKWMASDRLQVNGAKTEVLWCASNRQQHLVPSDPFFCLRRYCQAGKVCSRSGNISGHRHVHEDSLVADCIQLFCSSATDTQHPSFRQSASFTLSSPSWCCRV